MRKEYPNSVRPELVEGCKNLIRRAMQPFFVYILRCSDGSYYTGHTDDIEARLSAHKLGTIKKCYTYKLRPIELVYVDKFGSRDEAINAERQIKGWSRRKKMALMNGEYELLKYLSRCKSKK